MGEKLKYEIKFFSESVAGSYSQVFFSTNPWFALLLFLASFTDPYAGASGFICMLVSVLIARGMGFNRLLIANGTYSYNSLLVGLAIGAAFQFSAAFFATLLMASFLTFLITVWMSSVASTWKVPFLSLPFVIATWIVIMSARNFDALHLSERGIFTLNELFKIGGAPLVTAYEKTNSLSLPFLLAVYLKSLGAVFFQNNILSGFLIALGLLIYSRIAFFLSLVGFLSGYAFCYCMQGNMTELTYTFIGFNYILCAIALGGFFVVPSTRSIILAICCTPLTGLFISAFGILLAPWQLSLYSLPFTLAVILVIFVLNNRSDAKKMFMVQYQQFSPEKNLYVFLNHSERFKKDTYFHIQLPFFGEWMVSQGHNGKITHKENYRFAFDFVIADESRKTYREPGTNVKDFYCYNLPVLAPAAGYVVSLEDGIEDNVIGDVNIEENWGNSIVIKHGEGIFSKISHIKSGSFKVQKGDYVKRGEVVAACGNSGRSPEPHIHFQLQATPEIGATTLKYPFCYYIHKKNGLFEFHAFDYPQEGQILNKTTPTPLLQNAFHFIPGKVFRFDVNDGTKNTSVKWEVFVDAANLPYIYCHNTGSYAYFTNNETLHYFTDFKGDKNSLLYYFYLGAHKILLSYFQGMKVKDVLPLSNFHRGVSKFIQDFIAPFTVYLKAEFTAVFAETDEALNPSKIKILSSATAKTGSRVNRKTDFEIEIDNNTISKFIIKEKNKCITALQKN